MEVVVLRSCLSICGCIGEQLLLAKHNKDECRSLRTLVACIEGFLGKIPAEAVSETGGKVLEALQDILSRAESFLKRIGNTGPLISVMTASIIKREFLLINRDLTNTFQILAAGEKLLEMTEAHAEVPKIMRELRGSTTFFAGKAQLEHRLQELAAAAQQQKSPDEVLNAALLKQLDTVEEITLLSPSELLQELRDLQLAAMYGDSNLSKDKLSLGSQTEEFLIQQLCAALSPKAAQANEPLTPSTGPNIPDAYLCPISKVTMANPVVLAETGQTYEAVNIQRWLESHNTCPVTNKVLKSKLLTPNYSLKTIIHEWAQQHGVKLPRVEEHVALLEQQRPATMLEQQKDVEAALVGSSSSAHVRRNWLRCTRTKWVICLIAAVVALGVGIGVGLHFYFRKNKSVSAGVSIPGCPGVPAAVAKATWATATGGTCAGAAVGATCLATCIDGLNASVAIITSTCREDGSWGPANGACKLLIPDQRKTAAVLPGMPPAVMWMDNAFSYQLYKPARNWRQAEELCSQIAQGFHLASINTDKEFNSFSNHLVYANSSSYSYGSAFLVGCNGAMQTVWVGLHDPNNYTQSTATWHTVADTFVWSDNRSSPFLLDDPDSYFVSPDLQDQEEHCIGFTFCSNQNSLAKLDKHPCDWEMSFLCKGPVQ